MGITDPFKKVSSSNQPSKELADVQDSLDKSRALRKQLEEIAKGTSFAASIAKVSNVVMSYVENAFFHQHRQQKEIEVQREEIKAMKEELAKLTAILEPTKIVLGKPAMKKPASK